MSRTSVPRTTPSRKKQHIDVTLTRDVRFREKTTGLEHLEFVNNALPELDFSEVDPSVQFLGRTLRLPLMISCMTGGYAGALKINRNLAEVCEELQIAMGVGSQRQAPKIRRIIGHSAWCGRLRRTFPLWAILALPRWQHWNLDAAKRMVDLVRADEWRLHLNPLQEFLQPEGTQVSRSSQALTTRGRSPVPVIVKEIGAGISEMWRENSLNVGVRYIDVAGAGGTSWAGVETLRRKSRCVALKFWDWGIPLSVALTDLARMKKNGENLRPCFRRYHERN
jgi:isopentenyl-diphosphate delta-isomerase